MFATIKGLPLTFYSRPFYQHLVREGSGIGAGFIVVLATLSLMNAAIMLQRPVQAITENIQSVLEAMPEATIKDHTLSISQPVPYAVKALDMPDDMPNRLVIDTNYKIGDLDALNTYMNKGNIFVLVTANKLITRQKNELRIDDMKSFPDGMYTHDKWSDLSATVGTWVFPGAMAVSAIVLLIVNFVLVLIVAIMTKLLGALFRVGMGFDGAMRLAAAAGIPAGVLLILLPTPFWLKAVIWTGYAAFGLSAVKAPSNLAAD